MGYFFVTPNQAIFNKIISYCTYIKYILYRRYGICVMCIHTVYVKWKNHIVGIKCSHLDPTLARAALSLTRHCLDQSSVFTQRCPVRRWSIKKHISQIRLQNHLVMSKRGFISHLAFIYLKKTQKKFEKERKIFCKIKFAIRRRNNLQRCPRKWAKKLAI